MHGCSRIVSLKYYLSLSNLISVGRTIEHAARSCKDIQRSNTGLVHSGKYWLSPQQYDDSAFIGYCNMDDAGGGWTLTYSFKMQRHQNRSTVEVIPRPAWRKHEQKDDETVSKKAPRCKLHFSFTDNLESRPTRHILCNENLTFEKDMPQSSKIRKITNKDIFLLNVTFNYLEAISFRQGIGFLLLNFLEEQNNLFQTLYY